MLLGLNLNECAPVDSEVDTALLGLNMNECARVDSEVDIAHAAATASY